LRATSLGVAMHPMSQSLQEYAEVASPYAGMHKILAVTGRQRVQMLARIGYADDVPPAPRWSMERHLIKD
jgi:hypothetical protein